MDRNQGLHFIHIAHAVEGSKPHSLVLMEGERALAILPLDMVRAALYRARPEAFPMPDDVVATHSTFYDGGMMYRVEVRTPGLDYVGFQVYAGWGDSWEEALADARFNRVHEQHEVTD